MKDFLCIYEMLLDELANYKISEVAALGQKFQLEITETSIRSDLPILHTYMETPRSTRIKGCQGCQMCFEQGGCPQTDDMHTIKDKMLNSQIIVLFAFLGAGCILSIISTNEKNMQKKTTNMEAK